MFWGSNEIEWEVLHRVSEKLTDYHHLRKKFNIQTSDIKFLYQRFIPPDKATHHANRFNFLYELHRARGLHVTDPRDRVFAFLGHYAHDLIHHQSQELAAMKADYSKAVEQVYVDVAARALQGSKGDSALIALAAVQHHALAPLVLEELQAENGTRKAAHTRLLPSWVPDWRTYQGFILSEPISPHRASRTSAPKLNIDQDSRILHIHGVKVDIIKTASRVLRDQEFHSRRDQKSSELLLPVEYLWRDICQKTDFNLNETYLNGQTAFFAFSQALSNGCVQAASRVRKHYNEIPEARWLQEAALYLRGAMGSPDTISLDLLDMAEMAEREYGKEGWSRCANGASKNRKFARTTAGYYVLGPAIMDEGDIVCVLFGGKMPFCLRPSGRQYILVGECYAHGLMKGEVMDMMTRNELVEQVFELI